MPKKNGFILLIVILFVGLALFCVWKSADIAAMKRPASTKEPASTAVPASIDLVLPAPDVYLGLSDKPKYAADQAGPSYSLDLAAYPASSMQQYISLLSGKYGLTVKPREKGLIDSNETTLTNDAGQACVEIVWLEGVPSGNRLLISFGKNCATAALETLEAAQDVRPITEDDWISCAKCGGENRCQACDGRGRWRESDWDGFVSRSCSVCNGDGECHADGCVGGRVFRPHTD